MLSVFASRQAQWNSLVEKNKKNAITLNGAQRIIFYCEYSSERTSRGSANNAQKLKPNGKEINDEGKRSEKKQQNIESTHQSIGMLLLPLRLYRCRNVTLGPLLFRMYQANTTRSKIKSKHTNIHSHCVRPIHGFTSDVERWLTRAVISCAWVRFVHISTVECLTLTHWRLAACLEISVYDCERLLSAR